jgi:hypothetical protein
MSICPICGQDHHLAIQCIGSQGGRASRKDPETQRAKANKRWAKWHADHPEKVKKVRF